MRWRYLVAVLAVLPAALLPAAPAHAADATRSAEWFLSSLKIATAHKITQGRGVTVAVIDTGVFVHEDLKDRVLSGYDYTTPAGGNGQVDTDGHGTWIAGLIAGRGHGSGLGLLGVAPSARILPLRVAPVRPNPTDGTVAKAILQAMKRGAKIIHLSGFGGDQASMDAVAKAVHSGVIVIAATGNSGFDTQIPPPASWPGVITASGVDKAGKPAPLYVTGSKIDFAAPGVGVITTDKTAGAYATPLSTSTASAIVAGVAALVWAKYPKLKAAQVIQAMRSSATDKGAKGRDPLYGSGIVNPVGALTAAQAIASPSPSPSLSPSPAAPSAVASEEAPPAVSPVAAAPPSEAMSPLTLLTIAFGVIVLVIGVFFGLFLLRRSRATPPPPHEAWAPQPLALPPPISPLAIGSSTGSPASAAGFPASAGGSVAFSGGLAGPAAPPAEVAESVADGWSTGQTAGETTQPLRTVSSTLEGTVLPAQRPARHAASAEAQPAPLFNRPPVDAEVLNQPTVGVAQPRFAFPVEDLDEDGGSIYDTASFPVISDDRR